MINHLIGSEPCSLLLSVCPPHPPSETRSASAVRLLRSSMRSTSPWSSGARWPEGPVPLSWPSAWDTYASKAYAGEAGIIYYNI